MNVISRIGRYFLHFKLLIAVALAASIGYAVMNGASAYLIGPFMKTLFYTEETAEQAAETNAEPSGPLQSLSDAVKEYTDALLHYGEPAEMLVRLCFAIIIVIILKNIFSYLHGYVMAIVEQGVVRDLRNDVYTSYHNLPLRYFQKRKTGDLISRVINDCNTVNTNFNNALENLMKEPVNILVLLAMMIITSWKLTLMIFVIAPPSLWFIGMISKRLRKRTTRTQTRMSDMTSVIDETISNIRIVKAFAMERFELEKFRTANRRYFKSMLHLFWTRRLAPPVTEILGVSMAVVVLWVGGTMVLESRTLDPEDFIKYILFLFLFMQSVKRLSDVNVKMQVGIAATERIFAIIDEHSDITESPDARRIENVTRGIGINDVWFEYDPGIPVLKGVSLTVRPGENIAIVGPSGGGKSTLVDLLPRFYDPTGGSIEIDGVDIREYRLDDLRSLFGIVTQETLLFHDTIRNNIAYGRPDIPLEEIERAAKTANAHHFISAFDDGYETMLGDRGTKLSGGQKQRIVIARAILKNPPVLIFDEATSALDSKAETEVQAAIDKLMEDRTSFVIAHRLSTIKKAHRIIVIDAGKIIEKGTHQELYEKGGAYRRLYDLQFQIRPVMHEQERM